MKSLGTLSIFEYDQLNNDDKRKAERQIRRIYSSKHFTCQEDVVDCAREYVYTSYGDLFCKKDVALAAVANEPKSEADEYLDALIKYLPNINLTPPIHRHEDERHYRQHWMGIKVKLKAT